MKGLIESALCVTVVVAAGAIALPGFQGASASSNTWSSGMSLPTPRMSPGSATVGHLTYTIGGGNDQHGDTQYTVNEAYDPTTDSWAEGAPMPTARQAFAVAVGPGKNPLIFAIGGCPQGCVSDLSVNEAYDPVGNSWSEKAPKPTGGWGLTAATAANGLIYVFGGDYFNPSTRVEAYNPATDSWSCSVGDTSPDCASSTIAPIPEASFAGEAIAVKSTIYLLIGRSGSAPTGDMYAYNVQKNRWKKLKPLPTAREYAGAAVTPGKTGAIFVLGGCTSGGATGANEAYGLKTKTWTTVAPAPTATCGPGYALMSNGAIQVAGGGNDGNLDGINANQLYTP